MTRLEIACCVAMSTSLAACSVAAVLTLPLVAGLPLAALFGVPAVIIAIGGIILERRRAAMIRRRRARIERRGAEWFLRRCAARQLDADEWGTLWEAELPWDEPLVVVEVVNSTPERDGSFEHYYLRVPPHIGSAKWAVAWTFELLGSDYSPTAQT